MKPKDMHVFPQISVLIVLNMALEMVEHASDVQISIKGNQNVEN